MCEQKSDYDGDAYESALCDPDSDNSAGNLNALIRPAGSVYVLIRITMTNWVN